MFLALEPKKRATIKEIAEKYRVSRNHLVKVVHRLASLGYLESVQGRGGGISLARPASKIGVGEVVRTMEATLNLIDCVGYGCPLTPACRLKRVLNEGVRSFLNSLDAYTISDLVQNRQELVGLIHREAPSR